MSYQVLALKWRPRLFKDAVGQEHVTRTLKNSIINNKIGHAYLLTGTRGIGKTTIARIFAKAIRCENRTPDGEPCLVCESCKEIDSGQSLDYLEIDGASNNSVDDIRELIENVQYLPASGKYKVYIIDEVHMLTVNAFNALLKTLEEPPKHVVFIFATTDPQKLLGTVLSRCLRFDFKNASEEELTNHIKEIAKAENLTFSSDTVPFELAKQAKGSFRDALSLFDQVISLSPNTTITEDNLYMSLGMADTNSVNRMISAILLKDKLAVKEMFDRIIRDNIDFKNFSMQVLNRIYDVICNINDNSEVTEENLQIEALGQVGLNELMWIYETLFKDLDWSFNTFEPQKATAFVFMKTAMREMILTQTNTPLNLKKKLTEPVAINIPKEEPQLNDTPQPEIIESVKPEVIKQQSQSVSAFKSWDNFLVFLYKNVKVLAVNLERGNLINAADFGKKDCVYHIGFKQDCKIFFDYLVEGKNSYKLKEQLCDYLGFSTDDIEVNVKIVDEAEEENFFSHVDIDEQNKVKRKEELKQNLLNNKYIKNAEQLFSAEINKVVLNKNE